MAGDRVNTFVIRALLKDEGPARVMDGSFMLMDIAAAQLAFDRLGRVDRLDVQLTAPMGRFRTSPRSMRRSAQINARLPDGLGGRAAGAPRSSRWSACWPRFT